MRNDASTLSLSGWSSFFSCEKETRRNKNGVLARAGGAGEVGAAAIKAYLPDVDVIYLGQRRRPPPCLTIADAKSASKRANIGLKLPA